MFVQLCNIPHIIPFIMLIVLVLLKISKTDKFLKTHVALISLNSFLYFRIKELHSHLKRNFKTDVKNYKINSGFHLPLR